MFAYKKVTVSLKDNIMEELEKHCFDLSNKMWRTV